MYAVRFIRLISTRASVSPVNFTPVCSPSRALFDGNFRPVVDSWMKSRIPQAYTPIFKPRCQFDAQKIQQQFSKLKNAGGNFSMRSAVGFCLSASIGSLYLWVRTAYALDGFDDLFDDNRSGLLPNSKTEIDYRAFFLFLKRLLVPLFLMLTIYQTWGHPLIIAAKVSLIVFMTKPRPPSINLYVGELLNFVSCELPFYYRFQSLHASKVDVEDYVFFSLAEVEVKDYKAVLVGILGSWWPLPVLYWQDGFSKQDGFYRIKYGFLRPKA